MAMKFESKINFVFKIEPKPEGGFVCHSDNPPFHADGETREEVEAKLREEITKLAGPRTAEMLTQKTPGTHVVTHTNFSFKLNKGGSEDESSSPALVSDTSSPFDTGSGSGSLLGSIWKILVVVGIAVIIWMLVQMRR